MILFILVVQSFGYISLPLVRRLARSSDFRGSLKSAELYENSHLIYAVDVYLGNPGKLFNLMIDNTAPVTTTQSTWVEQIKCTPCTKVKHRYNPSESITFRNYSTRYSDDSIESCYFSGHLVSDFITMNGFSDVIEARINFTAVSYEEDCSVLAVDGALALAPYSKYIITYPIVMSFKNSGEINNAVFALYVNNFTMTDEETEPQPTLEIGGFDLNKFSSKPEELFYIEYQTLSGVRTITFDSITMGLWSNGVSLVKFSTIERNIIGDLNDYFGFVPFLVTMGLSCETSPENFVITCDKPENVPLPGFAFKYLNYTIELSPYSIWDCHKESCVLLIEFKVAGYWVFGQLFLENYYTIYNYDNSSIGFAPAAISHKKKQDSSNSHSSLLSTSILILILSSL